MMLESSNFTSMYYKLVGEDSNNTRAIFEPPRSGWVLWNDPRLSVSPSVRQSVSLSVSPNFFSELAH